MAGEERMPHREAGAAAEGLPPAGCVESFREQDERVPAVLRRDARADDERRRARGADELGERRERVRVDGRNVHDAPRRRHAHNPETQAAVAKDIPMHRVGWPDDVKPLALFLASPASEFITGQEIVIDGGWGLGPAD